MVDGTSFIFSYWHWTMNSFGYISGNCSLRQCQLAIIIRKMRRSHSGRKKALPVKRVYELLRKMWYIIFCGKNPIWLIDFLHFFSCLFIIFELNHMLEGTSNITYLKPDSVCNCFIMWKCTKRFLHPLIFYNY